MSEDKTGGPAFPQTTVTYDGDKLSHSVTGGMTLLDYFYGQVIGPLVASALKSGRHAESNFLECPEMAYTIARAMIAARKKL